MSRITITDTRKAFTYAIESARGIGLDVDGLALIEGSKAYGRAFRVVRIGEGGSHGTVAMLPAALGMTAGEAYDSLIAIGGAWASVPAMLADGVSVDKYGAGKRA